ncbi:MAG: hypothetical protein KJ077_10940 [Anaerolineae bacterium]|nr:hypothetical protein [Anaerolineae bacterium]
MFPSNVNYNRHEGDRKHYQQKLMKQPKGKLERLGREMGCEFTPRTPKPVLVAQLVEARFGEVS